MSIVIKARRLTDLEKQDMAKRYAAGESLKSIAEIHKTTKATVSEIGRKFSGAPKRSQGAPSGYRGS